MLLPIDAGVAALTGWVRYRLGGAVIHVPFTDPPPVVILSESGAIGSTRSPKKMDTLAALAGWMYCTQ